MSLLCSIWVSQHAQHQGPETESAEWNSANIQFNIHTCAFPTVKKKSFSPQSNNLGKNKSTTYSQEEWMPK